jgi:S1-C subfamily serine protease
MRVRSLLLNLLLGAALAFASAPAPAQTTSVEDLVSAVVRIKTFINPDGRTVQNLGREREGSGIVIDGNGLVLTIGYLMVEAHAAEVLLNDGRTVPAEIVGYDHETGFGLLKAIAPLRVRPIPLGKSAELRERDPALVASHGGPSMVAPVHVVAKREFSGSWEYLLDEAIFTSPPHPAWSGAALINREGKLVGVGSLIVSDAAGTREQNPGNMFVPIDRLPPILAELIAEGRAAGPLRPWLGLTTEEIRGRLLVIAVAVGGPAEQAGVKRGDLVIGVAGEPAMGLSDFYRKAWAKRSAGDTVPLDVMRDNDLKRVEIKSMNRMDHLKLKSTF